MTARTPRRAGVVAALVAAVLSLAACGSEVAPGAGDDAPEGGSTVSPTDSPSAQPEPTDSEPGDSTPTPPRVTPPGAHSTAAVADLAERLGITADEVDVTSIEEVMWRDGSIGCPEKGKAYTMALVPGFRMLLDAGGKTYAYHQGKDGKPFLCTTPQSPAPGPPTAS